MTSTISGGTMFPGSGRDYFRTKRKDPTLLQVTIKLLP